MKIIVVGATAAGTTFAAKMRRNHKQAEIILLDKSETMSLGACGLPFYVGGFFDDASKMIARTPEQFIESGIDARIMHEVIELDASKKIVTIRDLAKQETYQEGYDTLVIASGARVLPAPFSIAENVTVHTLRRLDDGEALHTALRVKHQQRVTIIGAGFIGIELIEACLNLNHKVALIDVTKKPLAKTFDEELQDLISLELKSHGVTEIYGYCAKSVLEDSTVVLENGQQVASDLVIWSGGIVPATDWLAPSGIQMERGVIQTNKDGLTSLEDVYAIGDCATVHHAILDKPFYSPLATVANKAGRALADHLAGIQNGFVGMMGSASVKACDLEVVRVGLTEDEAKYHGVNYKSSFLEDRDHTGYYPDSQKIWIKLVYDLDGVILGAQIAGKRGAALRGSAMALAITKKMTVLELGFADIPYSPPFSRTWDALNVAGNISKV
ncbi:CoA-disulfide reductase [Entomospira entomophila]|uniref:CoA-disulfide reductase n=1 Tax=Entomospira entomophila TaxID=2719988 RepID=A0A968G8Y8_9SPIO|nr:CoA-disulfide reductase [Entomospira entomophilus]NIZ40773.1 CoA-disulfide reductase [Entomospira entomophilus]WDI34986.1 CoA-disulfide reductase [Entomospira entomophilus]